MTKPSFTIKSTFFLLLAALVFLPSTMQAQSKNVKPNIAPDELTAKGAEYGWTEGTQVSNLTFNDVNNKQYKLYDLLKKPVVIEFWSLNSAQSQKNKKYLKAFYKQFDINVVSISTDEYPNKIRKMVQSQQIPWPNIQDDSAKFSGSTFQDAHQLSQAKFMIITPDKQVYKIFNSEKAIGKVGVELQKYFGK